MIAVTCRNGEHFFIDPVHIERVECDPDTVIRLDDRTKYVVTETFDELLRTISAPRASVLVVQKRLSGGTAAIADHASTVRNSALRLERRQYRRDDGSDHSPVLVPPDPDAD